MSFFFFFLLSLLPCFRKMPVINANNVDPDQMPHSGSTLFANVPFMGR